MILLLFGIIIGILLSILTILVAFHYKQSLQRIANKLESRLMRKGAIIEPESEELNDWIKDLPHE